MLTKDLIASTLRAIPGPTGADLVSGEHLVWTSLCDTFVALKLQLPKTSTGAAFDDLATRVHTALTAAATAASTRLDSLVIEFVDHAGSVVHTRKFGGLSAASSMNPAANTPRQAGSTPSTPTTPAAASGGHTPIGGLSPAASRSPSPQGGAPSLPGIRRVIAVGAGKGGVGKSTVALNIAVGLARRGHAVGLLDGDIYGPSMPTMLALGSLDAVVHQGRLQPFFVHGIKCMTLGKLVDAEKPLIWRGPMAHGAFKQLTEQTEWGELDYLIIDLPPGTGDVSLTMAQLIALTGAVVVCTPQKVAQDDAVRAARMFQQLQIDVLGVVENMSHFVGDDGKIYDIFGKGGAEMMAQRLGLPFLGACPITMSLRKNSDSGDPTANFSGTDPAGQRLADSLEQIITNLEGQVALAELRRGEKRPTLTIS